MWQRIDPDRHARDKLAEIAAVLAAVHLDRPTIQRAGRESGMLITLEGTQVARAIAEAAEARGVEKGREQGARSERERVLSRALTRRFGAAGLPPDRLPAQVDRLADHDLFAALEAIRAAETLARARVTHLRRGGRR